MSKKLLVATAAVSSAVTVGILMLASAWWEQTAWPSDTYLVHLKDGPKTALRCEVLTTFLKGERILSTFNQKEGRYAGCYLFITGKPQPDGSFVIDIRPSNPFSVRQWLQTSTWVSTDARTFKAADIDGLCRGEGAAGVAGAAPTPSCVRFQELMKSTRPQ